MKRNEFLLNSSRDKHEIYTYKWGETDEPKAIIQIVHGAGEYANRYDTFAKALVSRGFIVYAHDHRGHGQSVCEDKELIKNIKSINPEKEKIDDKIFGYFGKKDGFRNLVEDTYDVTQYIKKQHPDKKVFMLGHSMGSFIARYYAILYSSQIDGLLIVGTGNNNEPELKLGIGIANLFIQANKGYYPNNLLDTAIFKAFNLAFANEKDTNAWLTRDKESRKEFNKDTYCGIKFTAYAFRDMFEGVRFVTNPQNIEKVRKDLPIFILSGDKDPVGGNGKMVKKAYKLYTDQGIQDIKIKLYKDMRHEILNEIGKQEVYKDIIIWINKHI